MSNLFIDTETTGKLIRGMPLDEPQQPRIVQLAAILADDRAEVLAEINLLIYPEDWTIPEDASAIHGITTEQCRRHGLKITLALELLKALTYSASTIVAHNLDFDLSLIQREHILADLGEPFIGKHHYCTMKAATDICNIPGRYGPKWPTLAEAHQKLFNCDFENAHDAMADVRACMRIYFKLQEINGQSDRKSIAMGASTR